MSHGTRPGQRAPAHKTGRNKRKCDKYILVDRRTSNKVRRIAKNGGTKKFIEQYLAKAKAKKR